MFCYEKHIPSLNSATNLSYRFSNVLTPEKQQQQKLQYKLAV